MLTTLLSPSSAQSQVWIRVGGVWRVGVFWIRVGGVWKVSSLKIRVAGSWR